MGWAEMGLFDETAWGVMPASAGAALRWGETSGARGVRGANASQGSIGPNGK